MSDRKYTKPALTIEQQISFLAAQGFKIEDHKLAQHVLSIVGYYRLSGYLLPFKLPHHNSSPRQFKPETTISQIWALYQFDQELRLLVTEALEKIEVAFRAALTNVTSIQFDPFWYAQESYFKNLAHYRGLWLEIEKLISNKHELFLNHYYAQYDQPKYPPVWMLIEVLSFGACSKLFGNIKQIAIRNQIADHFGQHTTILESWLQTLTYARNLCAHHARLWNRWFLKSPRIPNQEPFKDHFITDKNYRFHLVAYVIYRLLEHVSVQSVWRDKLRLLFDRYESFPGIAMGFQTVWQDDVFWSL